MTRLLIWIAVLLAGGCGTLSAMRPEDKAQAGVELAKCVDRVLIDMMISEYEAKALKAAQLDDDAGVP
jgi:hypothetical protein